MMSWRAWLSTCFSRFRLTAAGLIPPARGDTCARLWWCIIPLLLALAACRDVPAERLYAGPLPTLAVTALPPFAPSATPVSPTPAPTLPSPTPTPEPTADHRPPTVSATDTPLATRPSPPATPTPDPVRQINGVPFDAIAVLPPETQAHVAEIMARGRELGRNANAFSKLGDSAVLTESNLTRFDNGPVALGPYAFLQPTIDHYAGSWARYGVGARVALTTIGVFDPMWASPEWCQPGEHLLACELRLHNPSVLLIRLGTNDGRASLYEQYMRQIVQYAVEQGVVPVLGTKADRFEGDDSINEVTRRLAAELRVPLWEFDRVADTLPGRGLTDDHAHLTVYGRNDYTDPETLTRGYPVSDLTALVVLDALRQMGIRD